MATDTNSSSGKTKADVLWELLHATGDPKLRLRRGVPGISEGLPDVACEQVSLPELPSFEVATQKS